jgi:hypothetical protein
VKHVVALAIASAATIGAIVLVSSCKQGEGDRCQVDADCEAPLVCNGEKYCSSTAMVGFDAEVPIDAPADAMIDAPDAPPDI